MGQYWEVWNGTQRTELTREEWNEICEHAEHHGDEGDGEAVERTHVHQLSVNTAPYVHGTTGAVEGGRKRYSPLDGQKLEVTPALTFNEGVDWERVEAEVAIGHGRGCSCMEEKGTGVEGGERDGGHGR